MIKIPLQYPSAITGCIGMIIAGMFFGWSAPSLPQLLAPESQINMTSSDGSWVSVMPCIGAIVGCLIAAKIVDNIGRKKSILLASPLYFISWILIAFAQNKYVLYAARFTSGIGDGFTITTLPMYISEISDPKVRGLLGSSVSTSLVIGHLCISIIGSRFSIQTTALISSVLPILQFLMFCFMPKSPYFLLMKDRPEEATRNLIILLGRQNVLTELARLSRSVKEDKAKKNSIWDLFTVKSNRRAVYIIVLLRGLQQWCGTMVITFYVTIIFNKTGSNWSSSTCTSIYFGIQVIFSILCSCLVDKVGRKPLLILSTLGSCIALAVQGGYFYLKDMTTVNLTDHTWIPIAAILSYNVLFSLGMGNIPSLYLGELFPTNVKALALGLADIYFGLVVISATKFFQIVSDSMGMYIPFFVFSAFCGISLVYSIFWIPETKGKTLEDIQDYLKGVHKKPHVEMC